MKHEILQCYLKTYGLSGEDYTLVDDIPVFHSDFRKECYSQFGMGWVCGREALMRYEEKLKCQD